MIEFEHKLPAMNIDGKRNGTYNNRELGFPSVLTTTDPKLGLFIYTLHFTYVKLQVYFIFCSRHLCRYHIRDLAKMILFSRDCHKI